MKRTLLALLVGLSLLLSLAACGSGRASAQEVTEQGLAALRDLDVLALPQYWNTDGLNLDDLGDLTQAGEEVRPLRRGHRRPGPGHDPAPLLAGDLRPGGPRRRHGLRHRLPHQPGHGPGGGPVPPGGLFRRLELRPPGRWPAAHGGGDDPAVPPDPHRPAEPGGFWTPGPPRWRSPSPWWTASGRSPPTRPWWTPCWGACSPQGRPSPACWRSAPPDRLSPPRPANGPSPGGEGPFRFPGRAKARRLGGAPWASVPVSSSCCGCSWPRRAPPPSRAGCWEGRTPPRGSGSGGRSRRDPRPRPRRRRCTPGWACSSRTWG